MDVDFWEELASRVESCGGVWKTSMRDLRNAYGRQKLGRQVRAGIANRLHWQGLAHFPAELPGYQEDLVWIYAEGSPFANRISAILDPSEETAGQLEGWMRAEATLGRGSGAGRRTGAVAGVPSATRTPRGAGRPPC